MTRDGQWIYFAGEPGTGAFDTWRVHPDGSGLRALNLATATLAAYAPSVNPAGTAVAFVTGLQTYDDIRVRNIVTGTATPLALNGSFPAWSPLDDRIAFIEPAGRLLRLVAPDGTGARTLVSTSTIVGAQIGWSSDGAWIAFRGNVGLEIVQVATGLVIPLPHTDEMSGPAWRPAP